MSGVETALLAGMVYVARVDLVAEPLEHLDRIRECRFKPCKIVVRIGVRTT